MVKTLIFADSRYPVNRQVIRKAVLDTLLKLRVRSGSFEVSVAVVGGRKMRDLSEKFLKDNTKHEVLSFPLEDVAQSVNNISSGSSQGFINFPDGVLRLGDIVLCWPELVLEASRNEVMVDDELYFLMSHGVEHLLGKHHDE